MDTKDFLLVFAKRGGPYTMGPKINGWKYETYMRIAALTSYLKFECDFDKDGLCKNKRRGEYYPKKEMCCCSGCRPTTGHMRQLPGDFKVVEYYAKLFDDGTGFWRKGTGCVLPRSHRSPTCLTHTCDYNICRPASHKHLMNCLIGKRGSMIVDGKRSTEYDMPRDLEEWLKRSPTYNTARGSIDYGP